MAASQRDETITALVDLRDRLNALPETVAEKQELVGRLQRVWDGLALEGFHLPRPSWMGSGLAVSRSSGQ